ncbi:hypothetical protein, partial [Pseudaquabacterium rugosum]
MSTLSMPPGGLPGAPAPAPAPSTPATDPEASADSLRGPGRRDFQPRGRFGPSAIAVMAGAHVLLGYGLMNGLGSKAVEILKKPLEA